MTTIKDSYIKKKRIANICNLFFVFLLLFNLILGYILGETCRITYIYFELNKYDLYRFEFKFKPRDKINECINKYFTK